MPPRRSSRSRGASVEPVQPAPPTSKRKRPLYDANQPTDNEEDVKPTVKGRRATRGKAKVLEDVRESDEGEEEEVEAPPVKKSRPSLEAESDSEDELISQPRRRNARAGSRKPPSVVVPSAPPARKGRAAKKVVAVSSDSDSEEEQAAKEEDDDDEEEEEDVKPRFSRRKSTKAVDVSSDDDFEDEKPARRGKATRGTVARGRRGRTSVPPRASSSSARGRGRGRGSRAVSVVSEVDSEAAVEAAAVQDDGEESDSLSYADPEPQPASRAPASRPIEPIAEVEEEEEEHSLLEPEVPRTPTPKPQAHVQPVVNVEPQGLKARLVIHKMVLVNFKSYAGRQEIGPFHKVLASPTPTPPLCSTPLE